MGDPIVISGLSHWFGAGEARKQALFDIDLRVARGSLTVLMGPSGSGKTTLLTLIGCLRDVQAGSVRLLGTELHGLAPPAQVRMRRRLGFIFQGHNLHEALSARQNVRMALGVQGRGDPRAQDRAAEHMLGLLGLAERVAYLPANLSGGQKQRVAIARALVANPEVVLADEPTAALDLDSGLNMVRLLRRLGRARGTTSVMVTHDPRILDLADRILTLEDGRLVGDRPGKGAEI
ncbi:ATP-binding cassette domain-containing protein [Phaeovulum vinaykumarii]|uniref:Putative ABC transport system ATP-binding protein n=1 Tax=Phaeovulum vinaykumarii TaxID=407234 RepID=A0A1N7L1W9_9RHOB|nr:ATP-binding cassette domain-containing protein [Phaeovulum vinaykumarii]SIS67817.1 putative ABC transport system ATP-binding protein [Phaeovulum vinaykumarii]SOC00535.1 putative ABC transport system ATP-binding protein [Phaeovulum vinaykumarii]